MAQYKVPQDVEADDKLLGPFSFRQFVYLLIAGGLIALAVGLFQLFPLLAIIPVPFILFFAALALPLRKDQPMETYLAAMVSYYLKPHNRMWTPGQRESTIEITAPKIVEESRVRDITGEEATHRLSFLADIVDTGGYAIKGASTSTMREDLIAEANAASDMFENGRFNTIETVIEKGETERHSEVVQGMKDAITRTDTLASQEGRPLIQKRSDERTLDPSGNPVTSPVEQRSVSEKPDFSSPVVVVPGSPVEKPIERPVEEPIDEPRTTAVEEKEEEKPENVTSAATKHSIMELANNSDYSIATIQKEAKRIKERGEGEVFISLH